MERKGAPSVEELGSAAKRLYCSEMDSRSTRTVQMNGRGIMAVVVSYNGGIQTARTVRALLRSVEHVHIVDNGSERYSLFVIQELANQPRVSLNLLHENRGIGCALNTGVREAMSRGYAWVLTMDQDSLIDDSMVANLMAVVARDEELVCLSPSLIVNGKRVRQIADRETSYAITSGNLVKVELFNVVGLYDEGFFVDGIDVDFSLRVRRAGYRIYRVGSAVMHHELGQRCRVPDLFGGFYTLHSPLRRYYMYRNYMYLLERYILQFPGFSLKLTISHLILIILVILYDPDRKASLRFILEGISDYFRRRRGAHA